MESRHPKKNGLKRQTHSKRERSAKKAEADTPHTPVKSRKRRKIKAEDRAYHPRKQSRHTTNSNTFHFRFKAKKNPDEKIVGLYYLEKIEGINTAETAQHIAESVKTLRDGKPLTIFVKERSATGTPNKLNTPGGTIYYKTKNYNSVVFFSNIAPGDDNDAITQLDNKNALFNSITYQYVKENDTETKSQRAHITSAHLRQAKKDKETSNGHRSQNKHMAKESKHQKFASATEYAKSTNCFPKEQSWEWLHLIAYSILGEITQNNKNLVCGSFDANTDMMFAEAEVQKILAAYPQGFELDVTAHMVENTQLCYKIEYVFRTDDFTIPFVFHAQTRIEPNMSQQPYIQALTQAVLTTTKQTGEKEEKEEKEEKTLSTQETTEKIYYSPGRRGQLFLKVNPPCRKSLSFEHEESKEEEEDGNIKPPHLK